MSNNSLAEQFDRLYGQVWAAFFKADATDLTQHERQLLHHIPVRGGVPLGTVAAHLGIPLSSASEQVKSLHRRGFVTRRRDLDDERRLSIGLTAKGAARVASDTILDRNRLATALGQLSSAERDALLAALTRLVAAAPGASAERARSRRPSPGRLVT
jgi:DNA-binding MarR family transcriptional regulator